MSEATVAGRLDEELSTTRRFGDLQETVRQAAAGVGGQIVLDRPLEGDPKHRGWIRVYEMLDGSCLCWYVLDDVESVISTDEEVPPPFRAMLGKALDGLSTQDLRDAVTIPTEV